MENSKLNMLGLKPLALYSREVGITNILDTPLLRLKDGVYYKNEKIKELILMNNLLGFITYSNRTGVYRVDNGDCYYISDKKYKDNTGESQLVNIVQHYIDNSNNLEPYHYDIVNLWDYNERLFKDYPLVRQVDFNKKDTTIINITSCSGEFDNLIEVKDNEINECCAIIYEKRSILGYVCTEGIDDDTQIIVSRRGLYDSCGKLIRELPKGTNLIKLAFGLLDAIWDDKCLHIESVMLYNNGKITDIFGVVIGDTDKWYNQLLLGKKRKDGSRELIYAHLGVNKVVGKIKTCKFRLELKEDA